MGSFAVLAAKLEPGTVCAFEPDFSFSLCRINSIINSLEGTEADILENAAPDTLRRVAVFGEIHYDLVSRSPEPMLNHLVASGFRIYGPSAASPRLRCARALPPA